MTAAGRLYRYVGPADLLAPAREIAFRLSADGKPAGVATATNQSTGYCPDPACWPAVAAALERAGLTGAGGLGGFTAAVVFRRCPACRQVSIVREGWFVCVFCDGELPAAWNVDV